jgi:hypothetical protein
VICSELDDHMRELEEYIGTESLQPTVGVIDKMRFMLRQASEVLSTEVIGRALIEVNRKIASSLSAFMVCQSHLRT